MNDDVKAAAKRLIAEAAIAEREMLHMYSREHRPDYLTVARFALEAADRQAALAEEMGRLKAELHGYHVTEALRWSKTAPEMEDCPRCAALDAAPAGAGEAERCSIVFNNERIQGQCPYPAMTGSDMCADHDARRIDRAPAVAPGASDAGDGDGER
jgi:hypothetical protein